MIGRNLAHYRVTDRLGAGGMGEVWRATDSRLGRDVALKILPPAFAADADRMARFEREARVLASLNHPGIASIYGLEREGDLRFLAMELADGEDLAQRLARGPLTLEDALDVARQLADGLEEAHARGIVHRDLKPANIKVSPQGKVKILDFGLAKAMTGDPEGSGVLENSPTIAHATTRAGIILGTAAYMSPEQARGKAVDARTDVWAFGCVLFEMLAGRSAFAGETVSDTIAAILEREPDWSALPASVPAGVRRVIGKCLRKDPARRLHSMADARIELQESMESPAGTEEASASGRRWPGWVLPAVVVVGPLLGALVGGVIGRRAQEAATAPAGAPAAHLVLPLPDGGAVMPTPAASAVTISRDSRYVAYVAMASSSPQLGEAAGLTSVSTSMIFLRPLDGSPSRPVDGTFGGTGPFFSPDARWVGFHDSNRGWLRKVPREGGAPVDLCDLGGDFRSAYWMDDGRILFSQGGTGGIREVPEDGGESRPITAPDASANEKTRRFGERIPGTDAVVFMLGTTDLASYDDATIALFRTGTGETRSLVDGGSHPRWVPTGHIVFSRNGRLLAVPFDRDALQVRGAPFPVLDDLVTSDGWGTAQYSFSDQGTLVYVRGGPDHYYYQLFTVDLDGSVETLPAPRDIYGEAAVNPDGNRIALSVLGANASLWTYDIARRTMTRLTDAWDNTSPVWSPDGERIAYVSSNPPEATWIMEADGAGEPVRLGETFMDGAPNTWSSDGRLLAFSQGIDGKAADIWVYSLESDRPAEPLISSKYAEYQSRFSPDCRHIAYVSDESGQPEVYVQLVPPTGRKWKLSSGGGGSPVWSPDGRRVYYWQGHTLMVVPVRPGAGFSPERARPLIEDVPIYDVQSYDIFPDGKRFLLIGRAAEAGGGGQPRSPIITQAGHRRVFPAVDPDIHVVTGWFSEFER